MKPHGETVTTLSSELAHCISTPANPSGVASTPLITTRSWIPAPVESTTWVGCKDTCTGVV
jgi:hypothetical protein